MLVPAESKHPSVQKGTQVAAQRPSRYHSESSEFADDDVSILTRRWQRKVWGCKSLAPSIVCQIWAAPGAPWAKKGGALQGTSGSTAFLFKQIITILKVVDL